jgi:hypothetical protein
LNKQAAMNEQTVFVTVKTVFNISIILSLQQNVGNVKTLKQTFIVNYRKSLYVVFNVFLLYIIKIFFVYQIMPDSSEYRVPMYNLGNIVDVLTGSRC